MSGSDHDDDWLTVEEAAARAGMSPGTLCQELSDSRCAFVHGEPGFSWYPHVALRCDWLKFAFFVGVPSSDGVCHHAVRVSRVSGRDLERWLADRAARMLSGGKR